MESGIISERHLSASSQFSTNHSPNKGRLHSTAEPGAWSSLISDLNQWLQIDVLGLDRRYTRVTRVATQGRHYAQEQQWVTKYKVHYGDDGVNFQYYKKQGQTTDKVRPICNINILNIILA